MKKIYAILAGICLSASIAHAQCYDVLKTQGVTYSTVYNLKMDIYTPIGAPSTPRPLLIMAHGGSFSSGDRTEYTSSEIARRFASRGFTTCSIDYRLESSTTNLIDSGVAAAAVIHAVSDMKAAIRFFKDDAFHSNLYNIDTNTVYVGGNSAGAITAVNLAYLIDTNDIRPNDTKVKDAVRNNGGLEGNSGYPGYSTIVQGVLNFAGGVKDTLWIHANGPKIYSAHGDADRTVPYNFDEVLRSLTAQTGGLIHTITLNGSGAMKPRLDEMGVVNQLKTYVGSDHVPWEADTNKWNEIDTMAANFLGVQKCYKQGYTIAGINDLSATTAVALYPNPASNMITIHADAVIENINVVDRLGRVVSTYSVKDEEGKIDVSALSTGIYIARINLKAGGNVVRTFTVE